MSIKFSDLEGVVSEKIRTKPVSPVELGTELITIAWKLTGVTMKSLLLI